MPSRSASASGVRTYPGSCPDTLPLHGSAFLHPDNGFFAVNEVTSFRLLDAVPHLRPCFREPPFPERVFLIEKPKTGTDDFARGTVASALDLPLDEFLKLFSE